jgi:hypothetical protein
MKSPSVSVVFPAVALSLGATAAFGQPSYAYSTAVDRDAYSTAASGRLDDWDYSDRDYSDRDYSDRRVHSSELDRAYRPNPSNYHYAHYYIARPEYLL